MQAFSTSVRRPAAREPSGDEAPPLLTERSSQAPPNPSQTWPKRFGSLLLLVAAPTLLTAAFVYLVVADQYVSEARFVVRSAEASAPTPNGLGQLLGMGGGSNANSESEALGVYLQSHDAVAQIGRRIDLRQVFRRPEADPFTRLWSRDAQPETLLKYYRGQVRVAFDSSSGITTLTVRAFRPVDAQAVSEELLRIGEARVNSMNQRVMEDALRVSRRQLAEAETEVAAAQVSLTRFRQTNRNIDPDRSGAAGIALASDLEGRLAGARAELRSMTGVIDADSPQFVALRRQVEALEVQVAGAHARLAGPKDAMAGSLGVYEELRLHQEFAAKRYETAASALETARRQALGQQLFVVRLVEPNRPVKSLYPERGKIVATVLTSLLLVYAIGWLMVAGVREHAA